MKKVYLSFLFALLLGVAAHAQTKPETLTNAKIVSLVKAGLSSTVILATIQNANTNFDTSTNAIIDLKQKGVSDDVIAAMINKSYKGPPIPAANAPQGASPLGPVPNMAVNNVLDLSNLTTLEPGIYYYDETATQLNQMDGSIFSQTKMGSGIITAITYGVAKTKAKAVLSGAQANFSINTKTPTFYFIFPHTQGADFANQSAAGNWYSDATSPNEFLLVKFKVKEKSREIVTGSYGTYSGFSGGIDDDNKIIFRSEKIAPGIYKVYPDEALSDREYAFLFAGTAATARNGGTSQKAFDFSVAGNTQKNSDDPRQAHRPPPPPNPLNLFKRKQKDTTAQGN